jgi:phage-related protein
MSNNAVNYTFVPPFNPDWGMKRDFKPRVLKVEFGDGYSQRAADGFNNNPVMLSLGWTNLTTAEKDTIIAFLTARKGYQSFWYTYQDETTPKAYVCEEFSYDHTDPTNYTISATFRQVYDIAGSTSTGVGGGGTGGSGGKTSPYQDYKVAISYTLGEYWQDGVKLLGGYPAYSGYTFTRTGTDIVLDTPEAVGLERLRNTDFKTASTWTTGTNWAVSTTAGTATATAANTTLLTSTGALSLIVGRTYRVQFTVSAFTSGSVNIRLGNSAANDVSTVGTSAGTFYYDIKCASVATDNLSFFANTATLTISNVSVKEIEAAGSVTYDIEMAVNGTFDASTGWTSASGASIANHVLALGATSGGNTTRLLGNAITIGEEYEVVVNVKSIDTACTPTVRVGQTGTDSLYISKPLLLGKNIFKFIASVSSTTANTTILNTAGPGTTGTIIEDISIRRMLRDGNLLRSTTDYCPYGNFATLNGRNWTLTGGVTILGIALLGLGGMTFTASGAQSAQQTLSTATLIGERYEATVVVTSETADGLAFRAGTSATPNLYIDNQALAVGTNIIRWTATTANATPVVQLYNNSTGAGTISSISVRKLTMEAFDTFAANTPAIVTGRGFLSHNSATNNVVQSQSFATTWGLVNVSVTSDVMIAPDGTLTADLINEGVAGGIPHNLNVAYTNAATGTFTTSVFAKAGTGQFLQIIDDHLTGATNFCNFDLLNGVVGSATGLTGSMIYYGDGWWRCIVTASAASTSSQTLFLVMVTSNAAGRGQNYLGTGKTIYLWQAQSLNGMFVQGGPIVATTTTGVTTGNSTWQQKLALDTDADFLIFADVNKVWSTSALSSYVVQFSDGTAANTVLLQFASGNQYGTVISASNVVLNDAIATAIADGSRVFMFMRRWAGVWQHGYITNGNIVWGAGSATIFPAGMTLLNIGSAAQAAGNSVTGLINCVGLSYATYSTDAQIIALAKTLGATP